MTHKELLSKIEKQTVYIANKIRPVSESCEKEIGGFANALRSVIILASKDNSGGMHDEYSEQGYKYAMELVIQTIEKQLK